MENNYFEVVVVFFLPELFMNHHQLLEKNILLKYLVLFFLFYASWLKEDIFQSKVSKISWDFCKHRKEIDLIPWGDREKPNWKNGEEFV